MNKTLIKNYAVWARKDLIDRVKRKAYEYEVTDSNLLDGTLDIVHGKPLNKDEKKQRQDLIHDVKEKGFDHVMEEVAYTWFNRFIALRFMEVNNYLPKRIRIFTNENNEFKPQIIDEAMNIDLEGLDKNEVYELLQSNNQSELYKKLLIAICNDMGNYLPGMFKKIDDYRVLLFPDNLLNPGSVLDRLISDIEEDSFNVQKEGQVEIIGWFYQFYNTDPKAKVFARPKGQKIHKEDIPAATQLFTPDWIVRYMVENSLGRLWIEGHPNNDIKSQWKYYLDEAKQNEEVEIQLHEIRKEYSTYTPEMIKFIDPCMGSGHILIYAFEVLMQIYESYGYNQRDAAISIIQNNLYGIDIDERAYQLAYFAVMMKARQYNRRALTSELKPNLLYIRSSGKINEEALKILGNQSPLARRLLLDFKHGDELGSILKICYNLEELQFLENTINRLYLEKNDKDIVTMLEIDDLTNILLPLIEQAKILTQKYNVTVTNPPYLPVSNGSKILQDYVKDKYPDSKTDLFAVLMETCLSMLKENGYEAMINMHSWMFLSSFENLRSKLLSESTIINMAHLGTRAFEEIGGEVVQTTSFILKNKKFNTYISTFKRLVDFNNQNAKEDAYLKEGNVYLTSASNFSKIPGSPISYWLNDHAFNICSENQCFEDYAITRAGMITGNNDLFVRLWFEINYSKLGLNMHSREEAIQSQKKWFPYNKGGEFRKWYGNNEYVVNWENDGYYMRNLKDSTGKVPAHAFNLEYIFKNNVTWSSLSSYKFAARYSDYGYLYDASGSFADIKEDNLFYTLSFLCSEITLYYLSAINPTLNFQKGNIATLPFIIDVRKKEYIDELANKNISISKEDWDSFEISWDFKRHPLLNYGISINSGLGNGSNLFSSKYNIEKDEKSFKIYEKDKEKAYTIQSAFEMWETTCNECIYQLKANEEELNHIFIDIYKLQDELTPDVEDKDITLKINTSYRYKQKKKNKISDNNEYELEEIIEPIEVRKKKFLHDTICEFISYAVGCMFGRYSLDVDGLAYAGGKWDSSKYKTFIPDMDNIIPISDDEYFEDDIVGRFIDFVKVVYGECTLEENLDFIATALGGKGTSREIIRNYFLNEFYKVHCKMYQKRPIYWLFDSGKKNGFKALIYMHRYSSDLIARLRTQYVFEQQSRYRNQIEMLQSQLEGDLSSAERVKLNKQLKFLREQDEELRGYEEKVHHFADQMIDIDLDDGVKVNYDKFKVLLAKIK